MLDLDFTSTDLRFPCHPRFKNEASAITTILSSQGLDDHFLVFSSGTTGGALKGYALSRRALFANADAVNAHFSLTASDVWGLSLPHYHVGGLSVLARAHRLGSKLVDLGVWEPFSWAEKLSEVTITTVVPTQVYDFVRLGLRAPSALRFLVVGGDYLSFDLEARARALGWPVIRTFGMTEVCSQLASGKSPGGELEILPLHQVKLVGGRLAVKSEALFTLQFRYGEGLELQKAQEFCDGEGYYLTQDLADVSGSILRPFGRVDDQIKISGKLVATNDLREKLYAFALEHGLYGKLELLIEEDERKGKELVLLHLPGVTPPVELFLPLKAKVRAVDSFDRTDLGKLKRT